MSKFAKVEREVLTALADDLREFAVIRWPSMNHEWRKQQIARLLGMKVRRVRSYWDAEETMSPDPFEVDAIKALIGRKESAHAGAYEAMASRLAAMEADYAALRAEMARVRLALESRQDGDEGGEADGSKHSLYGRRSGDRLPFTDADEHADQSSGWGI